MRTHLLATLILSPLLVLVCGGARCEEEEQPRDLGIVEQAERRLVQVDVTVLGPEKQVSALTAADFRVVVDGREIEEFTVDRLFVDGQALATPLEAGSFDEAGAAPAVPPPGASYLFYFDQHHLTVPGRQRALDLSRELVARLITGNNRAMIVSSGQELHTFAELTSNRDELLEALDRLAKDALQWDPFPSQEDRRVEEIHQELHTRADAGLGLGNLMEEPMPLTVEPPGGFSSGPSGSTTRGVSTNRPGGGTASGQSRGGGAGGSSSQPSGRNPNDPTAELFTKEHAKSAQAVARIYQMQEKWHTEKALARFAQVLGRLDGANPPKVAIYFADRMRSNAGDHYAGLFSDRQREWQLEHGSIVPTYDQVIDMAAAHGVRLYTVQAEGLVSGLSSTRSTFLSRQFQDLGAAASTRRFTDAKNSLVGFALETGGQAFLNGVGPAKIAQRIQSDLECVYLISFDAEGLPPDRRLPLTVRLDDAKLEVRSRARIVVQSDSARLASRLTNAFSGNGRLPSGERLRTVVIPTGFDKGKYSALVQVRVPATEATGATWDIGLSTLSRGRPGRQASARVSIPQPGVPIVFEAEMAFAPGPYEVTAVAHDVTGDLIVSGRVEGEWPDPEDDDATVGPIAVIQPAEAVFVRGDDSRSMGPLARTENEFVLPDRPTALVAIVCRDRPRKLAVDVERRLEGQTAVGFPPLAVEEGEERCFLLSDLVPAGVMTEGAFVYSVRVLGEKGELAGAAREFAAIRPVGELPAVETAPPR